MNQTISTPSRKRLATILASCALFGAANAYAIEPEPHGWYVDFGLGASKSKIDAKAVNNVFGAQGLSATSTIETNQAAYKFDLGYQFNSTYALELGYADLGKAKYTATVSAPNADKIMGDISAHTVNINAVATAPLGNNFSIYGKLGFLRSSIKLSGSSTAGSLSTFRSGSSSGTSTLFGLGAGYDFSENIGTKLEWNHYDKLGSTNSTGSGNYDTVTVGIVYKF